MKNFQIYNEDCQISLEERIRINKADVIITSPPYNLDIKYKNYDDKKTPEEYKSWMLKIFKLCYNGLKTNGHFFLQLGGTNKNPTLPFEILKEAQEAGFVLQNQILWIKSLSINNKPVQGHVKPINSKRYLNNAYEFIFHMTKSGEEEINRHAIGVPYADKSNLKRWNNKQTSQSPTTCNKVGA